MISYTNNRPQVPASTPRVESPPVQPALPARSNERFVTKQQACEVLLISEATIGRWKSEDGFPPFGKGGRWRIWLPDLLTWFKNRER